MTLAVSDPIPAGTLPDGTPCHHDGELSTYCTRCWMNLYDAHPPSPGEAPDDEWLNKWEPVFTEFLVNCFLYGIWI